MGYGIHVNGVFRINYCRPMQPPFKFDEIFGKPYPFKDIEDAESFEAMEKKHWLPHGDERSCHMSIWENSNVNSMEAYTISVFEYLENGWAEDVINWFVEVCHRLGGFAIGQAVLTVKSDFTNQTQTMTVIYGKISIITYDKEGNIIEITSKPLDKD